MRLRTIFGVGRRNHAESPLSDIVTAIRVSGRFCHIMCVYIKDTTFQYGIAKIRNCFP